MILVFDIVMILIVLFLLFLENCIFELLTIPGILNEENGFKTKYLVCY